MACPLKWEKDDRKIIIQIMGAYEILFQVFTALNRKSHLAVGIHDIHLSDGREAMIGGGFQMAVGIRALSASVSRVTFHDRTVYFLYQVFDKCRLQEVMASPALR